MLAAELGPRLVLLLAAGLQLGSWFRPAPVRAAVAYHNGFQLQQLSPTETSAASGSSGGGGGGSGSNQSGPSPFGSAPAGSQQHSSNAHKHAAGQQAPKQQPTPNFACQSGWLTFELSTGFIYKPTALDTLAMMPSTLQLTDCLEFCLQNVTCQAINFEMGLCVLLSSSARQNPANLFSSQFPVFTIYAEKKCLLQDSAEAQAPARHRLRCRRAWSFERVAGHEMKTRPRRRLRLASREACMEACLGEREFECRSANWYRQSLDCTLSDQDRHSVSQSEAGDQQVNAHQLHQLYGPSNLTAARAGAAPLPAPAAAAGLLSGPHSPFHSYYASALAAAGRARRAHPHPHPQPPPQPLLDYPALQYADSPSAAGAPVDYLENNCVYEPNKLCEFRKIQNKVLKTVDSIYQDINSLEECKQRCLSAPYRCYSFDYGDTSERVCRTSHLDQASLLAVKEPYLEVMGAITYELAACFSVAIQCRAREMVAQVSSSKNFRGKIYAKSRPSTCVNDVREALQFELVMRYHDPNCDVRANSSQQSGVFSNDIVIQHHDRIVTTQDVGLSLYCQYDLGNRSITNNVNLAIERIDEHMESKSQPSGALAPAEQGAGSQQHSSALTITSLATTVVRSPNVTMRITNMNGQPVASATVGDRLALLFEIKEKTTPFGIFVREIIAMDGRQLLAAAGATPPAAYRHSAAPLNESAFERLFQANRANSMQLVDADGCPTDANIMGPLLRMDPAGHRILAPFNAFKFPASDMVFFRAVVSSCVSECRPAQCGPAEELREPAPPFYSSTTLLAGPSTTPSSLASDFSATTAAAAAATTSASTVRVTGDSLTTVPAMASTRPTTEAWPPSTGPPTATEAPATSEPPPTEVGAAQQQLRLDPQQRQQILKLLEARLRQQLAAGSLFKPGAGKPANSSLPDLASLYANLLTTVMLDPSSARALDESSQGGVTGLANQLGAETGSETGSKTGGLLLDLMRLLLQEPGAASGGRRKREAQPHYDMDELVVQSIKINDRLQFSDKPAAAAVAGPGEEAEQAAGSRRGHRSLARSELVVGGAAPSNATEAGPWGRSARLGPLGLLLVAGGVGSLQVLLLLLCLLDWGQRRRSLSARRRQVQSHLLKISRGRQQQEALSRWPPGASCCLRPAGL